MLGDLALVAVLAVVLGLLLLVRRHEAAVAAECAAEREACARRIAKMDAVLSRSGAIAVECRVDSAALDAAMSRARQSVDSAISWRGGR